MITLGADEPKRASDYYNSSRAVLAAIKTLRFHPNHVACSLSMQRTNTIGMVVGHVSNPFFSEMILGAESILHPLGFSLFLCNSEEDVVREEHYP